MWHRLLAAVMTYLPLAGSVGPNGLIMGCGGSESDGLYASSMNLWLRKGEPGVAFGLAKGPATPLGYGYVLLIKGDPMRRSLAGHNLTSSSDGQRAKGGGYVEINGTRADVAYGLEIGPSGAQDLRESLTINGEPFDPRRGRVFLVDLSTSPARVQQIQASLPDRPAAPRTTDDVDRMAKEHILRLRKESAAVRNFLK